MTTSTRTCAIIQQVECNNDVVPWRHRVCLEIEISFCLCVAKPYLHRRCGFDNWPLVLLPRQCHLIIMQLRLTARGHLHTLVSWLAACSFCDRRRRHLSYPDKPEPRHLENRKHGGGAGPLHSARGQHCSRGTFVVRAIENEQQRAANRLTRFRVSQQGSSESLPEAAAALARLRRAGQT